MNKEKLYSELVSYLTDQLESLPDKPEENPETTITSLWFMAQGHPKSAEGAIAETLPELSTDQTSALLALIERRLNGEPLAYITGRQQFLNIELLAGPGALIPRKETEILGEKAIEIINQIALTQKNVSVIDVCTGAGNLAVAFAKYEQKALVYAADLCADAVSLANANVDFLGLKSRVKVFQGDLLEPFDSAEYHNIIDVITCNPPYISSGKVEMLHKEISEYEPKMAFDGGVFGISILQRLVNEAPKFLRKGGYLLFEVGLGQGDAIIKRLKKNSAYSEVIPLFDGEGNTRAICTQNRS